MDRSEHRSEHRSDDRDTVKIVASKWSVELPAGIFAALKKKFGSVNGIRGALGPLHPAEHTKEEVIARIERWLATGIWSHTTASEWMRVSAWVGVKTDADRVKIRLRTDGVYVETSISDSLWSEVLSVISPGCSLDGEDEFFMNALRQFLSKYGWPAELSPSFLGHICEAVETRDRKQAEHKELESQRWVKAQIARSRFADAVAKHRSKERVDENLREQVQKQETARQRKIQEGNSGQVARVSIPGIPRRIVTFENNAAVALGSMDKAAMLSLAEDLRKVFPKGPIGNEEWLLWQWAVGKTLPWTPNWEHRAPAYRVVIETGGGPINVDLVGTPGVSDQKLELAAMQMEALIHPAVPKGTKLRGDHICVPVFRDRAVHRLHMAIDGLYLGDGLGHGLMIGAGRIKERGWSDSMIGRFLGDCDATCDNPHYKKAIPMRLWRIARVVEAEGLEAFKTQSTALLKRRQTE